uniref:Conantokin-Pr2 n=1 Tax=Conus parius TaxID=505247 RepID=CKP2_CONPI|nr:RecName: Full=Conantokin-Pr2; Short=Con-Pr2 [Conus parius]
DEPEYAEAIREYQLKYGKI